MTEEQIKILILTDTIEKFLLNKNLPLYSITKRSEIKKWSEYIINTNNLSQLYLPDNELYKIIINFIRKNKLEKINFYKN